MSRDIRIFGTNQKKKTRYLMVPPNANEAINGGDGMTCGDSTRVHAGFFVKNMNLVRTFSGGGGEKGRDDKKRRDNEKEEGKKKKKRKKRR